MLFNNDWDDILKEEINKEYFKNILVFLREEYFNKEIFPPQNEIFKAFTLTSFKDLKVVILGQDPYHGEGQAEGLSFSVKEGIKKPPSLKNIYKELYDDLGVSETSSGSLKPWAKEGVLLLNSVLTVEKDKAASHKTLGWDKFTDTVIKKISAEKEHVVFILWGNFAKGKEAFIDNDKHFVITSSHPSPFSAYSGFFGSKPFSKTNLFLKSKAIKEINWEIK